MTSVCRRDKRKIEIAIFVFWAIIISSALWYGRVFSYNDTVTHPSLTGNIAKIYNANFELKLTEQEIGWLRQGSIEEDTPPRWMNHFYNPQTSQGLWGNFSSKQWAQDSWAQELALGGNQTWQIAIESYVKNDKKAAFVALGHVLHLLEDATVPAHTRLDAHPEGDPYESWVFENKKENIDFSDSDIKPIKLSTLDDVFNVLAGYSNNNFLSKDTIGSKDKLSSSESFRKVFDDKPYDCVKGNQGQCLVLVKEAVSGKEYFLDKPVHSDYFSLLAPKAVFYGAGTIKLFFDEVEKRKKEEENKTWWQKLKDKADGWLESLTSNNLISGISSVVLDNATSGNNNFAPSVSQTSEVPASTTGGPGGNLATGDISISQYSLPANTVVAQNKIAVNLPPNTVMAQEKSGGNIVEQITPNEIDLPPAIVEERNPSQLILPKPSPTPSPSPLTFIPGVGSAPSPNFSPDSDADTTAPQTTITSAPAATSSSTTATFVFESSESGSTFKCEMDNATATCPSPKEYTGLSEGNHIFKVSATDVAGNQDLTPVEHSWAVSLSAPSLSNISSAPARNSVVISWISDKAGIFQAEYGTSTDYGFLSATTSVSTLNLFFLAPATAYHFRILAQDNLGNSTTSDDYIFQTSSQAGNVVISEIQISGGTASTTDEFVELYNPTSDDINLLNWRLTKKSSTGSTTKILVNSFSARSIPAHGYFLVAHPTGYDGTVPADLFYTSTSSGYSIADDNTVILYSDDGHNIVDLVGLGTASLSEIATIDSPLANQSVERKAFSNSTSSAMVNGIHQWLGNGYDSDNNSQDFVLQDNPNPQNSLMLAEPRSSLPNLSTASAWPTWQKNLARTGQSAAISLASSTMNVKWFATTTLAGVFSTRPVLDSGGNIYIGRGDGLAKYSSGGELLWLYATSTSHSVPLILDDDSVIFRGSWGLFSVDSQGRQKWKYYLGGGTGRCSPPAILSDGTLITNSDEKIYAINQDATLKWIFDPAWPLGASDSFTAPVVDEAGNIIMAMDRYIYKISPSGNLIWKQNLGNWYSSLALGADNTLYISTVKFIAGVGSIGEFYALNSSDGSIKWSDPAIFNDYAKLAPVIDSAGKIYVIALSGFGNDRLLMYNTSGTSGWSAGLASINLAAPILTSDGKIYVADQKTLKIFDTNDGTMSASFKAGDNGDLYPYFGAIGNDGTIYTANLLTLYAIDD